MTDFGFHHSGQRACCKIRKKRKTLGRGVGEGLVPSRRDQAVCKRNVRRIRIICEIAEHFLASFFQLSGGASPSLTGYARILQQVLSQLVKKVLGQDFFDCAFPPSILAEHKMLFPKSLEKQGFSERRALLFEWALHPRAPPLLYHQLFSEVF